MALNFPIPTSVGQVYQDPTSGNTYVCTSPGPPAQWVGSGSSTSLDSTYLRTDASNDPVTGNLLLNPSTNVSPLTLSQPVGNTTPALKIENSGSGNSIEANGFAVSQIGITSFPGGTVGSPSITTSGDTNTGIYFPAADTIGLVEGGVEVVRINSSGNVGINPFTAAITAPFNVRSVSFASAMHIQGELGAPGTSNQEGPGIAFQNINSNSTNGLGIAAIKYGTGTNNDRGYLAFSTSEISHVLLERVRIDQGGNVGIGTSSPAGRLHVNGSIIYTNRPSAGTITAIGFDANGALRASSSSLRYKHDIQDLETGLEEVMQLRPVQFKFNGETRTNMGFIAEEVDELGLEDVMLYNEENQPEGVIYANMVSLLTKAIQEQQAQIEELKAEINLLKGV